MKDVYQVVRGALEDLWDHAFLVMFWSLVWLFATLLVIPGPPATLALFDMAEQITRGERLLEFRDYLRAIGRRFGVGWRWAAINLPVLVVLAVDLRVVPRWLSPEMALPVQAFFLVALALWLVINWYALAFLFQQREMSVRQALRNGGVVVLQHPLFSLALALIAAGLLWLSLLLVIVNLLFGPMLVALLGTHAVLNRLALVRGEGSAAQ